jgi:macrolide transport system ATP-binding/permease protein
MIAPLLELDRVGREFATGAASVVALSDVRLTIRSGEFIAVMGPSGSGKSTLMNILGCLDRPTSGSYRVGGVDVNGLSADAVAELRRSTFGFVFQRYNLLADLTAVDNVALPALYAGADEATRAARAGDLLGQLGVGDRLHHRSNQLSGGQQQRVSIARALMNGGAIILADEPTGALDSKSGDDVLATLHELHRAGHTIILITHDAAVARHAERVISLKDGRVVADETTAKHSPSAAAAFTSTIPAIARQAATPAVLLFEAVKTALRSLAHHRLRSLLTMLGIIMGVGSVVAMLAIGNGAKRDVLERIQAMGTDLITIKRGAAAVRGSGRGVITLTPEDLPALSALPGVVAVTPETDRSVLLRHGSKDLALPAMGVNENYPMIRNWPTSAGAFFSAADVQRYAQVVVLGSSVAREIGNDESGAIGQVVMIGSAPFQVVGVMTPKGVSSGGYDRDYAVWIPHTTASTRLFGQRYFTDVSVKVSEPAVMGVVERSIKQLLIRLHGKEDFSVRNMAETIETANQTQNTLTYLLGAIAVISLLVGGIGVMNIMLVSVSERTREIGIRMAIGARPRDVMLQFLTEAVAVCSAGGVAGLIIGIGGGIAVAALMNWQIVFSIGPILLAFFCAFLTGAAFGFLPARKAAQLDPVIALARE